MKKIIGIKNILRGIVMITILVMLTMAAQKTYISAIQYEQDMTEYSKTQNIKDLAKTNIKEKFNWRNWFKKEEGKEIKDASEINVKEKNSIPEQTYRYVTIMSFMVLLVLLSYFALPIKTFNIYASIMAIIVLFYGLITPLMMVTIHKEISYLGDVVLSFESKSLITSISKLLQSNDYVIAIAILLFSVLVPVLKVTSLFLISVFEDTLFTHKLIGFFKAVGKWSMVDVFVVALLLVFISANKGDISKAEIEVGVYIFMCYVISSMIISVTADKMLKQIKYSSDKGK